MHYGIKCCISFFKDAPAVFLALLHLADLIWLVMQNDHDTQQSMKYLSLLW